MSVTHLARGGVTYKSIMDAGNAVLTDCCGNDWAQSGGLLPPIFIAKYTEAIDPETNKIKEHPELKTRPKGEVHYKNIELAQIGERAELPVHEFIESLVASATLNDYGPLIGFRNFVFDVDKAKFFQSEFFQSEFGIGEEKENSNLLSEFVKKNFTQKIRQFEFDNVCILLKIGVILAIEVKKSERKNAKKQLSRLAELLNAIFVATNCDFRGEQTEKVQIIKIIATPTIEEIKRPDPEFQNITKTNLKDPNKWWKTIIVPLLPNENKTKTEFFIKFSAVFAAVWAIKIIKDELCFCEKTFGESVQIGDEKIDQAHLSSRAGSNDAKIPVNDVIFNEKSSVFRKAKGIVLLYLTSEQHIP